MLNFLRHGHGKMIYPNGFYYEGQWKMGDIDGYGTLFSQDNSIIYRGMWKNGKYDGEGILYNSRQLKIDMNSNTRPLIYEKEVGAWKEFSGQFKNSKWEGNGKLFFTNGDYYTGEFKNNKANGIGAYIAQDGRVWKGLWEDNSFILSS